MYLYTHAIYNALDGWISQSQLVGRTSRDTRQAAEDIRYAQDNDGDSK